MAQGFWCGDSKATHISTRVGKARESVTAWHGEHCAVDLSRNRWTAAVVEGIWLLAPQVCPLFPCCDLLTMGVQGRLTLGHWNSMATERYAVT
jgi:hypothetical protein